MKVILQKDINGLGDAGEVKEVKDGSECGMAFDNYSDIQQGDMIECFEIKEVARTL